MQQSLGRATLLGLPAELRLRIYEYVVAISPAWSFTYNDDHSLEKGYTTSILPSEANFLSVPWLCLSSTCRTIRRELEDHIHGTLRDTDRGSGAVDAHRIYDLHTLARRGRLKKATWTSIPCPPSQCRALTAHITLHKDVQFGGDGGPMPIVRELYQTLNRLLHYGPRLDAARYVLLNHMVLDVLRLVVSVDESGDAAEDLGFEFEMRGAEGLKRSVCGFARQLERIGLLDRYVRRIVVQDGERNTLMEEFPVDIWKEPVKVPAAWDRYGFEWGVDAV